MEFVLELESIRLLLFCFVFSNFKPGMGPSGWFITLDLFIAAKAVILEADLSFLSIPLIV